MNLVGYWNDRSCKCNELKGSEESERQNKKYVNMLVVEREAVETEKNTLYWRIFFIRFAQKSIIL